MNLLKLFKPESLVRALLFDTVLGLVNENGPEFFRRILTLPEKDVKKLCDKLGIVDPIKIAKIRSKFEAIGIAGKEAIMALIEAKTSN